MVASPTESQLGGLASRACVVELSELPAATRAHAARVVADTIGVIIGGSRLPEVQALPRFHISAADTRGDALVLTPDGARTAPELAAFANGTAGCSLELDEGVRPTGHPAVHVVPSALAAAQCRHSSGAELLAAVISGYEVAARLFASYRLRYPVHPHGNLGAVGGAIAVARLLGTDPVHAALIAGGLPVLAVFDPCFEGTTARHAYAGAAGAMGVLANRLAAAGFGPSPGAYATAMGVVAGELASSDVLDAPIDLDDLWISRNYFKLHSVCALAQGAVDATLQLGPLDLPAVRAIDVTTVASNMRIARQPERNELSTRFSLQYAVAAAAVHGHAGPGAFVPDEQVLELARRVRVREEPELTAKWPEHAPTRVCVALEDGVREALVADPRGHHHNPAGDDDLRAKFDSLVLAVGARGSLCDYDRLLALEECEDVAELSLGDISAPLGAGLDTT